MLKEGKDKGYHFRNPYINKPVLHRSLRVMLRTESWSPKIQ